MNYRNFFDKHGFPRCKSESAVSFTLSRLMNQGRLLICRNTNRLFQEKHTAKFYVFFRPLP